MKAIVLAGGEGTRLRPLTNSMPKPMVPIGGRHCIDYTVDSLSRASFTEVIITTGYMSEPVIRQLESRGELSLSMLYSFEPTPLGTAGAVKKNEAYLDETFVVMSADVLADVDLEALLAFHRDRGAVATMALTRVEKVSEYGVVAIDDDGRIQRFQEKPRPEEAFSDLINAGIYVLEPEVLRHVPEREMFDFSKNLFPILLSGGEPMFGRPLDGLWMDIGRPRDLILANQAMIAREGGRNVPEGVEVEGPVQFDDGTLVGVGARVEGPSYVGGGVHIGEGASLVRSSVHDGTELAPGSVVEDSLVMGSCSVGREAQLRWSIVDEGCTVGSRARLLRTGVSSGHSVERGTDHEDALIGRP